MGIAENLRRLRKASGLSQAELAKSAGVSQQLISQLERGENASTKELPDLARAHNKTIVAWMFGLPAAISFLIAWACRYVLAGR